MSGKKQGERWVYEHAVEKSDLKPLTRLVLLVIAGRADAQKGMIRARFMPSAISLAAATGLSERRVRDHLKLAEDAGWLVIERRPGRKAMLALTIPGRDMAAEVTATPDDATPTPDVPAQTPDAPSGVTPDAPSDGSDLGVQTEEAQIMVQPMRARDDGGPVARVIIDEIFKRTGEKVNTDWAERVQRQILGRSKAPPPDDLAAYLTRCIRNEADPRNFLPTPTPPPYRAARPPARPSIDADPWAEPPRARGGDLVQFGAGLSAFTREGMTR